jgi:hypothetical protein
MVLIGTALGRGCERVAPAASLVRRVQAPRLAGRACDDALVFVAARRAHEQAFEREPARCVIVDK